MAIDNEAPAGAPVIPEEAAAAAAAAEATAAGTPPRDEDGGRQSFSDAELEADVKSLMAMLRKGPHSVAEIFQATKHPKQATLKAFFKDAAKAFGFYVLDNCAHSASHVMVFSRLQPSLDKLKSTRDLGERPRAEFFEQLARGWGRRSTVVSFRSDVAGGLEDGGIQRGAPASFPSTGPAPTAVIGTGGVGSLSPKRKRAKDDGKGKQRMSEADERRHVAEMMEAEAGEASDNDGGAAWEESAHGTQQSAYSTVGQSQDSLAGTMGSQASLSGMRIRTTKGKSPAGKAKPKGANVQTKPKAMRGF